MPVLAGFFLLTGLASIEFPGPIGFVAMELLVEGAVEVYPLVGTAVVFAAALNGIAILAAYFRVFTELLHFAPISLGARWPERIAVLLLSALVLGGGIFPQPGIESRHHAAIELVSLMICFFGRFSVTRSASKKRSPCFTIASAVSTQRRTTQI